MAESHAVVRRSISTLPRQRKRPHTHNTIASSSSSSSRQPTASKVTNEAPAHNLHIPAFALATQCSHALAPAAAPIPLEAVLLEHRQVLNDIRGFFTCLDPAVANLVEREWGRLMSNAYPELAPYGSTIAQIHALVVRNLHYRNSLDADMHSRLNDFIEYCCGIGNLTLGCNLAN